MYFTVSYFVYCRLFAALWVLILLGFMQVTGFNFVLLFYSFNSSMSVTFNKE